MSYRVLVTDEIHPEGVALLGGEPELIVDELPTLPPTELLSRIGDYDAIDACKAVRDALLSNELSASLNIEDVSVGAWTTGRIAFSLTRKLSATVVSLDGPLTTQTQEALLALPEIHSVTAVTFRPL